MGCSKFTMGESMRLLLQDFQNEILEAIVLGRSLGDVSSLICRRVEALAPGAICTLIRIRDDRLRPWRLPAFPLRFQPHSTGS